MSGLNVFVKKKILYIVVLLMHPSVTIVAVLTTLIKNLKKMIILVEMLFCTTELEDQ